MDAAFESITHKLILIWAAGLLLPPLPPSLLPSLTSRHAHRHDGHQAFRDESHGQGNGVEQSLVLVAREGMREGGKGGMRGGG